MALLTITLPTAAATDSLPSGTIVYENDGDLYAISTAGSMPRRLTKTPMAESSPSFSPDGRSIAFSRQKPNERGTGLWVMRRDGTGEKQLTGDGEGTNNAPAWLSSGTIVLSRSTSRFGYCTGLYLVAAGGGPLRRLYDPPGDSSASNPTASPDAARVAYVDADCEGRHGCCSIEVVNRGGKRTDDLHKLDTDDWELEPAWSPNGREVAFVTGDVDYSSIFVVRRDGSRARRVTGGVPEKAGATSPAWSPDGRWLVFSRYSGASFSSDLYLIRADGTSLRRLTRTRGDERWPTWSNR